MAERSSVSSTHPEHKTGFQLPETLRTSHHALSLLNLRAATTKGQTKTSYGQVHSSATVTMARWQRVWEKQHKREQGQQSPPWQGEECWVTAQWPVQQATSRLPQVPTAWQPCSLGMSMPQAKDTALAMQKMFSRTAGYQTDQRLKIFLFLQSWEKSKHKSKKIHALS